MIWVSHPSLEISIVKNDILAHCLKKISSSLTFRQNGRTAKINKNCLKHDDEMARVNRIDSIAFQLDVPYQFGSKIRKFRWELWFKRFTNSTPISIENASCHQQAYWMIFNSLKNIFVQVMSRLGIECNQWMVENLLKSFLLGPKKLNPNSSTMQSG